MPTLRLRIATLVSTLADDLLLAEPLLFPEVSCCSRRLEELPKMLARRIGRVIRGTDPGELYRRRLAAMPELRVATLELPPIRDSLERQSAVSLAFSYVRWRHRNEAVVAFVPALGIEVLAADDAQLEAQLAPQIQAALDRRKAVQSLRALVFLEYYSPLTVRPLRLSVKLPTLKQIAQREFTESDSATSVLKEVATNLRSQNAPPVYERAELLAKLAALLAGSTPSSVLLVGASGVGKSALMSELASDRAPAEFGHPPCWTTSGSRIVAGQCGYGMWQQRCQQLVREASRTGAIVHLGNFIELLATGKGGGNTTGVAALLRPAIASGQLRAVAECTPEQLAIIERENPQFLEAFTILDVPETTPAQTSAILARIAQDLGRVGGRSISTPAVAELDRLHRRYATYSAAPGRAVRFLRNLLDDRSTSVAKSSGPTSTSPPLEVVDVVAAFSRETGLPLRMLDDQQRLDLNATRDWFAAKLVGQPAPVELVTALLGSVKAALVRTGKPIASLLFIGPTGVGKTEMAKALAEFLYQDPSRMIRLDMSEYATPAAAARLIGGDGAPGRLTQEVRDQPFMVVLLDEFEKAHPLVFDMLLQVLGEGRLTDAAGRVADFTNSVVIMTSNLGVETYRPKGLGFAGATDAAADAGQHFERAVREFLRPELFNRIDRIVSFAPLGRETIARIARRELDRLRQRDGLRLRDVRLEITDQAVAHLADSGFAPRYGARPLKRTIERLLVAPLAERLCRYEHDVVVTCRVAAVDGALTFETSASPQVMASQPGQGSDPRTLDVIGGIVALRRRAQQLLRCGAVLRLQNEIDRLRQLEQEQARNWRRKHRGRDRGESPPFSYTPAQARALAQEQLLVTINVLATDARELEDSTLESFYDDQALPTTDVAESCQTLELAFRDALLELHASQAPSRDILTIAIFGESLPRVLELADAYDRLAVIEQGLVSRFWLARHDPDAISATSPSRPRPATAGREPVLRLRNRKQSSTDASELTVDVFPASSATGGAPPAGVMGVALQIRSKQAAALLDAETGCHEFVDVATRPVDCFVETVAGRLATYEPPADVGRSTAFRELKLRRKYDLERETCQDFAVERLYPLRGGRIDDALQRAVRDEFQQRIWRLLD